jgi:excisionase family DNA binding protein
MDVPPIERRYKIKELAELAAQSRRTIQRRIDDGIIRIVRLADGSTRITESEVVRYLNGKAGK